MLKKKCPGTLFMAKRKIVVTYTGSILCQSVLNIIFHFPLKSEKKKGHFKTNLSAEKC